MAEPTNASDSFPSDGWFRKLHAALEQSADFKTYGRWLKCTVAFRVDQQAWRFTFDKGLILAMEPMRADADVLINGSAESWKYVIEKGWALTRVYRYGVLDIRGEPISIMRNWKALFFITQEMKKIAA